MPSNSYPLGLDPETGGKGRKTECRSGVEVVSVSAVVPVVGNVGEEILCSCEGVPGVKREVIAHESMYLDMGSVLCKAGYACKSS